MSNRSRVILLNGPSSAGKSSIARQLQTKLDSAAVVSLDDYLRMSADAPIWEDDVFAVCPDMGRDISQALRQGRTVIVDHVITSERIFDALLAAAGGCKVFSVLVTCSADVLQKREAARKDRCIGSALASLEYLYPKTCYDLRIDSGIMSPLEAADAILAGLYPVVTLRDRPDLKDAAAEWFSGKWRVPKAAYLACMDAYLGCRTELGWYLCLDGGRIAGGLGVIENDFHDRKDLTPNICAVYTEPDCRRMGIAGRLLDLAVEDLRSKGISPVYLLTDHTGFYERYGWEFYCMAQGDGEPYRSRMYIHR